MSYIDHHLLHDEKVLFRGHQHWIIFFWPGLFTIISIILVQQTSIIWLLSIVTGIVALVYWITAAAAYFTSEYVVTNKRLVMKEGLLVRKSLELLLQKVEAIEVSQGILGRIFQFGTVAVTGTGGTRDPFPNIYRPLVFRQQAQQQIELSINQG